jgi:hypothetical protein
MAPGGSNGDVDPRSTTKPISLAELIHCTVVPVFTQKSAFPLGFWIAAVTEAALEVLLTSTTHGSEADPQVLLALHCCAGLTSVQAYWLLFDCVLP